MVAIYYKVYFALETIPDDGAFFDCLTARFSFNDSCGCFLDSLELLRSLLMLHSKKVKYTITKLFNQY